MQADGLLHTVVLVIRSQYEAQLSEISSFDRIPQQARIYINSPSAGEIKQMISKPADLVGLKFEGRLGGCFSTRHAARA